MATRCCKPDELDEDRTHTVRYWQESWNNGKLAWEDHGTLETTGTHNDAVALAKVWAEGRDLPMRSTRQDGTRWAGSEIFEGDGQTFEVWVHRSLSEIDYDEAREQ